MENHVRVSRHNPKHCMGEIQFLAEKRKATYERDIFRQFVCMKRKSIHTRSAFLSNPYVRKRKGGIWDREIKPAAWKINLLIDTKIVANMLWMVLYLSKAYFFLENFLYIQGKCNILMQFGKPVFVQKSMLLFQIYN